MGRGGRVSVKCREDEEHLVLKIQGWCHQTGSPLLTSTAVPLLFRIQSLLHEIRKLHDSMAEVIESERQGLMRKKYVRKRNRNRGARR